MGSCFVGVVSLFPELVAPDMLQSASSLPWIVCFSSPRSSTSIYLFICLLCGTED
jgi:hypothetical protein